MNLFEIVTITSKNIEPYFLVDACAELREKYDSLVKAPLIAFNRSGHAAGITHRVAFFMAKNNLPPIAFLYFFIEERKNALECEMWIVYVVEEYRRNMISIGLFKEALNNAYAMGSRIFIFKFVAEENISASMVKHLRSINSQLFPDCFFGKPGLGKLDAL